MNRKSTSTFLLTTLLLLAAISVSVIVNPGYAAMPMPPGPTLDPLTIPKYVQDLVVPPTYVPIGTDPVTGALLYEVNVTEMDQQILPPGAPNNFPMTHVWAYEGWIQGPGGTKVSFKHSPGATFEATRGIAINVTWRNKITSPHMFAVDPTLHWANPNNINMSRVMELAMQGIYPPFPPGYDGTNDLGGNPELFNAQSPVPIVTHLHGGEVQSYFDGGPDEWFTADGKHGDAYSTAILTDNNAAVYHYPNMQEPTTLWYHDHALGITRINVMSGLAGFYLLRDPADLVEPNLPNGQYEIPIAIQDRSFNLDGSIWFPNTGINPTMHPYWQPEFFGNTIMVNGRVWPNLNVDQGWYRFRLLDGSNARFYTLSIVNPATKTLLPFFQIGSDGGYLKAPVLLTTLTIAPGERADILVDFSNVPAQTKFILKNTAKAPFPAGTAANPRTVGQIMQFTVTGTTGFQNAQLIANLPTPLNPTLAVNNVPAYPTLTPTIGGNGLPLTRTLTLWEVMGMMGPLEVLLNGQKWAGNITELPQVGTTEDWIIVDLTGDTHPIHLHLVQFQLISRQKIDAKKYTAAWIAAQQAALTQPPWNIPLTSNAQPPWPLDFKPVEVPVGPYLQGMPKPAAPNEMGWKDTVQMNPGEVTIIRVRYAPQGAPVSGAGAPSPGVNLYPFDPTVGPGYVWHCHIIDHEDNEMMRPYKVQP